MEKKLYENPLIEVNRFEVINPLMVRDTSGVTGDFDKDNPDFWEEFPLY